MKKIYLLMALLLVLLKVNAQIDTTNLAGKYEYIFQQLDRNQIPTGFIDERAFPLISLKPFNGILTDSNKVNIDTWRGLYFTINSACLLISNPFPSIITANNNIATHNTSPNTSIPIALLLGKYNSVKSYAFSSNLLSIVNDQVLDVPNRSENPYLTQSLFAASPAKAKYPDENFSLIFKSDLFYTNSGLTVSNLYIDFDDGYGYRSASWNTAISPSYTSSGDKTLKFKLAMSDNSIYECYSDIYIDQINNIQLQRYNPDVASFTQPFNATSSHSGGNAVVRLSVNNSSGHIQKPLIVVEGYDAFSVAPTLAEGNYSYANFIAAINVPTTYNFDEALDDTASYDLVFIDYARGTDNIVRNAALLQEVITWVNSEKGSSTEQNVVMGISMGGLVARYALANMTKNNIATQTRLLITHDSPHQGANVPVGLQKLAFAVGGVDVFGYKIRDVFPSYQEAVDLLNEPATEELLKYRVTSEFSNITNNTYLASVYKPMVTFLPSGPQPTYRFIATSQGSECGTPLFAPGSNILNIQGSAGALIPLLLTTAKASLEIQANALPNIGSSGTVAKVRFMAKVKLFGFITIAKDFYNYTSNIPSSTFLPIDGATGGTSPIGTLDASGTGASGFFPLLYNYSANLNTATIGNFCFVPTASALDVQNFDNASLSGIYINGWSPTNPSSAETFITQESFGSGVFNEQHTNFTARNAHWLFNEMENISNNTLNCSSSCSPPVNSNIIQGSSQFCTTATYEVPNLPAGAGVIWTISPTSGVASLTTSGNIATLTKIGNGRVNIEGAVSSSCASYIFSKNGIIVGSPLPTDDGVWIDDDGIYPLDQTVNNTESQTIYINLFNTAYSNYSWTDFYYRGDVVWYHQAGSDGLVIQFQNPNSGDYVGFDLNASNSCGSNNSPLFFYYEGGSSYYYKTFPNPTNNTVSVNLVNSSEMIGKLPQHIAEKIKVPPTVLKMEMIDKIGNSVLENKIKNKNSPLEFDISWLKPDVYTILLHLDNGKTEAHKIVKSE